MNYHVYLVNLSDSCSICCLFFMSLKCLYFKKKILTEIAVGVLFPFGFQHIDIERKSDVNQFITKGSKIWKYRFCSSVFCKRRYKVVNVTFLCFSLIIPDIKTYCKAHVDFRYIFYYHYKKLLQISIHFSSRQLYREIH